MSTVVIDASVAVKWFLPEPHADAARRLLNRKRTFLAPDLIWAEVGNVLWKRVQRAELAHELAEQILRDFKRFPFQTYAAKALLEPAWALAAQWRISVYDGLYLALAISRNLKLVTANQHLIEVMKGNPLSSVIVWVEHIR